MMNSTSCNLFARGLYQRSGCRSYKIIHRDTWIKEGSNNSLLKHDHKSVAQRLGKVWVILDFSLEDIQSKISQEQNKIRKMTEKLNQNYQRLYM